MLMVMSPLNLTWLSSSDAESNYDEESFTVVRYRKDKRNMGKKQCVVSSRPMMRSQSMADTSARAPCRSDRVINPPERYK